MKNKQKKYWTLVDEYLLKVAIPEKNDISDYRLKVGKNIYQFCGNAIVKKKN